MTPHIHDDEAGEGTEIVKQPAGQMLGSDAGPAAVERPAGEAPPVATARGDLRRAGAGVGGVRNPVVAVDTDDDSLVDGEVLSELRSAEFVSALNRDVGRARYVVEGASSYFRRHPEARAKCS